MDQLDEWEKNFINMPVSEMFPLLTAGKEKYYLNFLAHFASNGQIKYILCTIAVKDHCINNGPWITKSKIKQRFNAHE